MFCNYYISNQIILTYWLRKDLNIFSLFEFYFQIIKRYLNLFETKIDEAYSVDNSWWLYIG